MLLLLCLIILVIGIGFIVAGSIRWDYKKNKLFNFLYDNDENLKFVGGIITVIDVIVIATMSIVLLCVRIETNAKVEQLKETFEAITYKVESGACRDELGLLSKEVIDEIQSWNESIIYNQKMQDNFWIGIFIPDVYDQFKTIDYEKYRR